MIARVMRCSLIARYLQEDNRIIVSPNREEIRMKRFRPAHKYRSAVELIPSSVSLESTILLQCSGCAQLNNIVMLNRGGSKGVFETF